MEFCRLMCCRHGGFCSVPTYACVMSSCNMHLFPLSRETWLSRTVPKELEDPLGLLWCQSQTIDLRLRWDFVKKWIQNFRCYDRRTDVGGSKIVDSSGLSLKFLGLFAMIVFHVHQLFVHLGLPTRYYSDSFKVHSACHRKTIFGW